MSDSYTVTTHSVKVRGIGAEQRELSRPELSKLFQTHLVFNELLEDTCNVILAMKSGAFVSDRLESELLRNFTEVALKLPANESNFLFTRLFKKAEKYDGAENSVKNLEKNTNKNIEKLKDTYRKEKWKAYFKALPISKELAKFSYDKDKLNLYNKLKSEGIKKPNIENVLKLRKLLASDPNGLVYVKERAIENRKEIRKALLNKHSKELSSLNTLLEQCKETLECLRKVKDGWYPLSEFYNKERFNNGSDHSYKFGNLKQLWHRQIFQQAIEHLKSHFELREKHALDILDWETALEKLKKDPGLKPYFNVREKLLNEANGINFKEITPRQFLSFLDKASDIFPSWQSAEASQAKKLLRIKADIYKQVTDPADQKKLRSHFKRDLYSSFPEIKELLETHFRFQKSFASKPTPPTYTPTSIEDHPRWLLIPAALWGKVELQQNAKSKKAELKIEIPLLISTENGLVEQKTWICVSGDPRLKTLKEERVARSKKDNKGNEKTVTEPTFYMTDKYTDQKTEVLLGAIRMEFIKHKKGKLFSDLESDCIFKLTIKRKKSDTEEWVKNYYKKKDPLTLEPLLPEKVIVCSFVHDVKNTGTFQAAVINPVFNNERSPKFLAQEEFKVDSVARPEATAHKRKQLENLRKFRDELQLEILEGGLSKEQIRIRLNKIEKREGILNKGWDHIRNTTDTRTERIAAEVVRRCEEIRKKHPEYKIVLGIEYRKDFKPKAAWAKDFNKLVMSTAGGALLEKIKQMCASRPEPIPVFGVPVYGLQNIVPSSGEAKVFQYTVDTKSNPPRLDLSDNAPYSVIVTESEGNLKIKRLRDTGEIVASNIIRRIVQPSRYSDIDYITLKRDQEIAWKEGGISEAVRQMHFRN